MGVLTLECSIKGLELVYPTKHAKDLEQVYPTKHVKDLELVYPTKHLELVLPTR
jgi:hypothetical protein